MLPVCQLRERFVPACHKQRVGVASALRITNGSLPVRESAQQLTKRLLAADVGGGGSQVKVG